ncbi:RHS repeat domain-containing protein [Pedobacter frigoris]|uniref:RHS repeat-associated core domain-containing protein n=1 Tax=Pedobacter frigoris TaxID=2571272 RepID=A0A4U1CPA4_9SPHI|nr:RHS repeat-associated core domain-containing protein [Pedobacter frigoris]TKC09096.1 RHS repeat-associated core domain-containing protein [Pedobacter frigoris]
MNRYALLSGLREKIDSLSYDYEGGRHVKIDDLSGASSGVKALGFNDQVQQATEYVYDGNGRLISDVNKGITAVAYNAANLPDEITWTSTKKLAYMYNAEGEKLQKKYVDGSVTMITAYNRGIEYVGTHVNSLQLQYVQTSEGRAWFNGSEFIYEYNLTDHLGNVRATIDADPSDVTQRTARLVQENSYYPFGMVMPGADINYTAGNKNNYLYTGKEFQEELGEYDHGARFYDPAIARWSVADPLAEQFYGVSPYNYVFNNPMAFTDPTGMYPDRPDWIPEGATVDENDPNRYYWTDPDGYRNTYVVGERKGGNNSGEGGRAYADAQRAAREAARNAAIDQRNRLISGMGWDSEWLTPETAEDRDKRQKREKEARSQAAYNSKKGNFGQNAKKPSYSSIEEVPVFAVSFLKNGEGATLPGIGIFVGFEDAKDLQLLRHEYGHMLQAKKVGYLKWYYNWAPASVKSAKKNGAGHKTYWTEADANRRSYEYFKSPKEWNKNRFPLETKVANPVISPKDVYNALFY